VSTILKSLKRLEKETAKEKAVPVFSTRQAMHRTVPFAWLKGRFMRWSLLAVVLIAGGVDSPDQDDAKRCGSPRACGTLRYIGPKACSLRRRSHSRFTAASD
jgi:hypothetical protein